MSKKKTRAKKSARHVPPKTPRVVIEVSGGVAEYATDGDVSVLLVDYDNICAAAKLADLPDEDDLKHFGDLIHCMKVIEDRRAFLEACDQTAVEYVEAQQRIEAAADIGKLGTRYFILAPNRRRKAWSLCVTRSSDGLGDTYKNGRFLVLKAGDRLDMVNLAAAWGFKTLPEI